MIFMKYYSSPLKYSKISVKPDAGRAALLHRRRHIELGHHEYNTKLRSKI